MRRILISLLLVAGWLASPVPAQTTGGTIRKFFGSGTPGSIVASRWGDIYINTATSTAYICSDTVAFCSGVASGEWVAAASSGGTGDVQGGSSLTTAGAIPFVASSATLTQNGTRLFWDNTNFRLGINTATPSQNLHVVGTALFSDKVTFTPNATNAGMNVGSYTGTSAFPVNGDMWYDPTLNKFRCYENSTTTNCIGAGGGGTVTSVGLSLPSFITVSGSPVTSSGTLTGTLASQSANLIFASPDGAAGAPTFRSFALGDVAANLLTFTKLQQIGTNTIVCNSTGGTANMSACSTATVLTMLSLDNVVKNNQANTYSGGGLQDMSAMKVKPGTTTVASLPTASSNSGVVYLVTDGTSLTDCATGGGSTRTWCVSNGTSWNAMTASSTGLGDPGSNSVPYRNGSGTTTPATATEMSGPFFCQDAGASDTYACSLSPAPSSYVTGTVYWFKANTANTGAATINFNSLGAKTIKKVAGGITTDLADNDIRAGQWVLVSYDGTNMQMMSMLGNAASGSDIQIFTSSGTWTKPTSCTSVIVTLIGGGGGGGSGRRGAAASNRASGAGGGGGAKSTATIQCSTLASTVSVTVATGGAGGAAVTTNDTNGNNGSNGTTTTFGSHLRAGGGALGAGGATGASAGGAVGVGEQDGSAGANGGTGAGGNALSANAAGGGGGGGGITSADTASAGGNGAIGKALTTANSAGGTTCSNGTAGTAATTNTAVAGVGGGGGGGCTSGVAGNGANGGNYGGGGGGGGASVNGNNSGSGGNGSDGIAIVITIP